MHDKVLFGQAAGRLSKSWGSVDMVSPWFRFDQTDYYEAEMGGPLFRRMLAFAELADQERLVDMKLFANELEGRFTRDGKRLVNIDPGYLLAERFVLATGKNFTHRIHLRAGVYADLTLIFQKGRFRALEWTYPDYAGEPIICFLRCVRDRYLYQLKEDVKG